MDNINNCTRCGAEFTDFKIDISFNIKVIRSQEDGFWEYIPNLDNTSREVLCFNCFTKFSEAMSVLNKKHIPEPPFVKKVAQKSPSEMTPEELVENTIVYADEKRE